MKNINSAIVIGVSLVICAAILSCSMVKIKGAQSGRIAVTGSATKSFVSDLIVWRGSFSKKAKTTREAFDGLQKDMKAIKKYLIENGVDESEIVFSSIFIMNDFEQEYNANGSIRRTTHVGYVLTQNVEIKSKEVDKIEQISRDITGLINLGVEFFSSSPEYYYTKLDELRLDLIAKSAENARMRAEIIARESGAEISRLRSANLGVFQITPEHSSTDFSFGGYFDVNSKNKTAFITTRLEYLLK